MVFFASFSAHSISASEITVVEEGNAQAVIVLDKAATELDQHAAAELARYLKEMSATTIKILVDGHDEIQNYTNLIYIGGPATNDIIERFCGQKLLKLSQDYPGKDGFIIKTLREGTNNYLILASTTERGRLYAVYHLLENYASVGFFWGGDNIPHNSTIAFRDIDIAEGPYFEHRVYMSPCAYVYSAQFWGFEDWKRELDWMAKKKFNILHLTLGREVALYQVMKKLGVEVESPKPWDEYEMELVKKIRSYAHQLGFRVIAPAFGGGIARTLPEAFRSKYPDQKYLAIQWNATSPTLTLYPDDPMFVKVGVLFIEEYNRIYGTDHLYNMDPYPEVDPAGTAEEKIKLKVDFAQAMAASIKAADPQGIWVCSGWAFVDEQCWQKDQVKAFLDAVPPDIFLAYDLWTEKCPVYKATDYFSGEKWCFSILHSMGGWTSLHGDLADLIKRVNDVVNDPKANNCVGFYITPEIIHHNPVYFDLAARLAWQPQTTLDEFLTSYCKTRYSKDTTLAMMLVWKELTLSVYGNYDWSPPRYQTVLGIDYPKSFLKRLHYLSHLEKAISLALEEEKILGNNHSYQIDIIDITRQYVSEVFNLHFMKLIEAFQSRDKVGFDHEAKILQTCLECQEKILSSDRMYYVETEVEMARNLPICTRDYWALPLKDNGQIIRQRYTALLGIDLFPSCLDYAGKDMYELVRYYYKPRFHIFIDYLREQFNISGDFRIEDIMKDYRELTARFIRTPFEHYHSPASSLLGQPLKASREVLVELSRLQ